MFVPNATVLRAVRGFVADTLKSWHADQVVDDAAIVACELATNALIHARSPFFVCLSRRPSAVTISVRDTSRSVPEHLAPDPARIGGRVSRSSPPSRRLGVQWKRPTARPSGSSFPSEWNTGYHARRRRVGSGSTGSGSSLIARPALGPRRPTVVVRFLRGPALLRGRSHARSATAPFPVGVWIPGLLGTTGWSHPRLEVLGGRHVRSQLRAPLVTPVSRAPARRAGYGCRGRRSRWLRGRRCRGCQRRSERVDERAHAGRPALGHRARVHARE